MLTASSKVTSVMRSTTFRVIDRGDHGRRPNNPESYEGLCVPPFRNLRLDRPPRRRPIGVGRFPSSSNLLPLRGTRCPFSGGADTSDEGVGVCRRYPAEDLTCRCLAVDLQVGGIVELPLKSHAPRSLFAGVLGRRPRCRLLDALRPGSEDSALRRGPGAACGARRTSCRA